MLEALICFFGVKENATGVGALDYSSEERKRLAILSNKWICDKCGAIEKLIPLIPQHLLPKEQKANNEKQEQAEEVPKGEPPKKQEEEETKADERERKEAINDGNSNKKKLLPKENQMNHILKNIFNSKMMDLETESLGERSGRERQNSSENLEEKYEEYIPFTFENLHNEFTVMQETLETIKFSRNFLLEEEEKQKLHQAQIKKNAENRGNENSGPGASQQNQLEELNIKSEKSVELVNEGRNSEEIVNESSAHEEERELASSMIQKAKQNLAVTDFFLFFLGSFLVIYILLYIYVF